MVDEGEEVTAYFSAELGRAAVAEDSQTAGAVDVAESLFSRGITEDDCLHVQLVSSTVQFICEERNPDICGEHTSYKPSKATARRVPSCFASSARFNAAARFFRAFPYHLSAFAMISWRFNCRAIVAIDTACTVLCRHAGVDASSYNGATRYRNGQVPDVYAYSM